MGLIVMIGHCIVNVLWGIGVAEYRFRHHKSQAWNNNVLLTGMLVLFILYSFVLFKLFGGNQCQ